MNRRQFLIAEYILSTRGGITRAEICERLSMDGQQPPSERKFRKDLDTIKLDTGLKIKSVDCHKNVWRYTPEKKTQEQRDRTVAVSTIVANFLESEFLTEFKDLGSRIQSVVIPRGNEYLVTIGTAMRENRKLNVTYHKFTDAEAYQAVLHPYCLTADKERWYLLAKKEESEHSIQTFALDRMLSIQLSDETFELDPAIDVNNYFRDAYGIWVDPEHYPVQKVEISCSAKVANYLRTLPLHHSQKEI